MVVDSDGDHAGSFESISDPWGKWSGALYIYTLLTHQKACFSVESNFMMGSMATEL